jgi:hypothetical protein
MRNTFIIVSLFVAVGAVTACGRPSSDIVHPKERPTPDSIPLRGSSDSCGEDGKVRVYSRSRSLCVAKPTAAAFEEFPASNYSKLPKEERCAALIKLVEKFVASELDEAILVEPGCETIGTGNTERVVSFKLQWGTGNAQDIRFSVEERPGDIAVWNCEKRSDNTRLCLEPVKESSIPQIIRDMYPYPSRNILNFYPTVVRFTGAK